VARAQIIAGRALVQEGRHAEARERLTRAVGGLRDEPDADTVNALAALAMLELFDGNIQDGESLAAEALTLGQALEVGPAMLSVLFLTRGSAQVYDNRTEEAAASYREAARVAELGGETLRLCTALLNLSDTLSGTDPAAAADAGRAAVEQARRIGARRYLGGSVWNLSIALLELGEWDEVAIGIRREQVRWAGPLAARLAAGLGESTTLAELFALLDAQTAGQLPPLLRAEDTLARARAAADAGDRDAPAAFSDAVAALRDAASPYRLAWGLIDQARFLAHSEQAGQARAAAGEALAAAKRLRCKPLLQRADALIRQLGDVTPRGDPGE
jgi:hypothetical protein